MQDVIKKTKEENAEKTDAEPLQIEWQAPEYEFRKKTADWFWAVGIVAIALIFSAVVLKNILFAVLAAIGSFSLMLYAARKPKIFSFSVGPKGIQMGERIYYYDDLKLFWINYNPPQIKELIIESKKTFMPRIAIMLGDTDPTKTRNFLLKFLPEQKIEESLITTISRILGF